MMNLKRVVKRTVVAGIWLAFLGLEAGAAEAVANSAESSPEDRPEMVLEVKAKRKKLNLSQSVSKTEVSKDSILKLPQGGEIPLAKLLATTSPGVVAGPFGQIFFRGNHANVQYQIDGIQMPDSPSNSFGQVFSPRNIDHMDVITGGIPAEFGQRLSAVINIVTRSGTETGQGDLEVNYGSYNTITPHLLYGGSNSNGDFHYFLSLNYNQTDRGLDSPQPLSLSNQLQGGQEAVHNRSTGNSEFAKFVWQASNEDKYSLVLFSAQNNFEIPNYPCSFKVTDPMFQPGFGPDAFGNGPNDSGPVYNFVPCTTNDRQSETNSYAQLVWKRTLSPKSFLQVAPYYKYSFVRVDNDPINDLATSASGATPVSGSSATSFYQNRHVNNAGLKVDYSLRPDESHLLKTGVQVQASRADGHFTIQSDLATAPKAHDASNTSYFESVYVQDDWNLTKSLVLNAGLRFDATQFAFSALNTTDSYLQPRVGLSYLLTDSTKVHAFYGKLFQPATAENLRATYSSLTGGSVAPYDIKAEKDDFYEVGVAQHLWDRHYGLVNVYYKNAENMLDDAQLLTTSIAQPYNFATGFAYGAEVSIKGEWNDEWSDYANYSYQIAKGKGLSGGIFAFPPGEGPGDDYQFLDHVQVHTFNLGLTYTRGNFWWTSQGVFGSGLRTGPENSKELPSHFTLDTTVGYKLSGEGLLSQFKLSADVLNVFDNAYPITIANGFNSSHYAMGRTFYLRLSKDL